MDSQNMNTIYTKDASAEITPIRTFRMSKEEAMQLSDEELLQMVEKATGHTSKDFSDYMNCDFSYTTLTNLLKDRGYENGWHKTSECSSPGFKPTVIPMKKSDEKIVRVSFSLDKSVYDEWKSFNTNVPFKTVTLGYALKRFMEDVRSKKIKFELEI